MVFRKLMITIFIMMCVASSHIQASFGTVVSNASDAELQASYFLAATNSKDRRDNRQDDRGRSDNREDRRDCRDDEGVAGKDKRDCKQDARKGKNDEDKDKD
jgi:hypothetical protein